VLDEARSIFGDNCLVSIGTGHPETIGLTRPDVFQRILPTALIPLLRGIATDRT
jgi:hypothetical protein